MYFCLRYCSFVKAVLQFITKHERKCRNSAYLMYMNLLFGIFTVIFHNGRHFFSWEPQSESIMIWWFLKKKKNYRPVSNNNKKLSICVNLFLYIVYIHKRSTYYFLLKIKNCNDCMTLSFGRPISYIKKKLFVLSWILDLDRRKSYGRENLRVHN